MAYGQSGDTTTASQIAFNREIAKALRLRQNRIPSAEQMKLPGTWRYGIGDMVDALGGAQKEGLANKQDAEQSDSLAGYPSSSSAPPSAIGSMIKSLFGAGKQASNAPVSDVINSAPPSAIKTGSIPPDTSPDASTASTERQDNPESPSSQLDRENKPTGGTTGDALINSPEFAHRIFTIESGWNPNARTGSNRGLGQNGPIEESMFGINDNNRHDVGTQTRALQQNAQLNRKEFLKQFNGREPTGGELYLMHQQGIAGGAALLKNPDKPAIDVLARFYSDGGRSAVRENLPARMKAQFDRDPSSITAKMLSDQWINAYDRQPGVPPARLAQLAPFTTTTNVNAPLPISPGSLPESPKGLSIADDLLAQRKAAEEKLLAPRGAGSFSPNAGQVSTDPLVGRMNAGLGSVEPPMPAPTGGAGPAPPPPEPSATPPPGLMAQGAPSPYAPQPPPTMPNAQPNVPGGIDAGYRGPAQPPLPAMNQEQLRALLRATPVEKRGDVLREHFKDLAGETTDTTSGKLIQRPTGTGSPPNIAHIQGPGARIPIGPPELNMHAQQDEKGNWNIISPNGSIMHTLKQWEAPKEWVRQQSSLDTAATNQATHYEDMFKHVTNTYNDVKQRKDMLELAEKLVDDKNFIGGTEQHRREQIQKFFDTAGVTPPGEGADITQAFSKIISGSVLNDIKGLGGQGLGQVRSKEMEIIEKMNAMPDMSPAAIRFVVKMTRRANDRLDEFNDKAIDYASSHPNRRLDRGFDIEMMKHWKDNPFLSRAEKDNYKEFFKPGQKKKVDTFDPRTGKWE